jgi:glycosyltransferase involved in cell wall biosynthesis
MRVTYYHRQPMATNFSVERLFEDVRKSLPANVHPTVATARFVSQGLLRRSYNIVEAPFHRGDVNHITGDVHYLAYLLNKERTLLTILDCVTLNRMQQGWRKQIFFFLWYWLPEKRCQLISVISESTRQELLQYFPQAAHKIRVVHCPVSEAFVASPTSFDSACPTILQVGTGANKNLLRVVEALKGIQCHLRIIGRLSHEQTQALVDNGIDYTAVSNISDTQLIEEYRQADIVVFASTYEGFGLPILEAQATGRPVITSNVYSMPEVAGDAACLVDPYQIEQIRSAIEQVINDVAYREGLVIKGFTNIERFRPEIIAQKYVALYQEILEGV